MRNDQGAVPQWHTGDRLRKAREAAGLTQQQLAEFVEISRATVSAYENNAKKPSGPFLVVWAARTGVSKDWIRTGNTDIGQDDYRRPSYALLNDQPAPAPKPS